MEYVYIVVDNVPHEFGESAILGVYDNIHAAKAEIKARRQIDDYANQYVTYERVIVRSHSEHLPVKKNR